MHNYAAVNSQALATSQEQQLSALGDGDADACPRYDDQTQALVERGLHLGDRVVLSCTVREGRPLYLTRAGGADSPAPGSDTEPHTGH